MIPRPSEDRRPGGHAPAAPVRTRIDPVLPREGYRLVIADDGVSVTGGSAAGVFYGEQTLRQLHPPDSLRRAGFPPAGSLPRLAISDAPRFGWRGVLLDVARHFMPVADVLRFIDLIAFHKLNVLHLHLTDDQGWRIEVPAWPRLTEVGAWRARSMLGDRRRQLYDHRPHGGFYTAADLTEIVAYAAGRHVTVVPEIDMPGHMQAAIAAYPELGHGVHPPVRESWGISPHLLNVSDRTLAFGRDVLDTVCAIFPGEIVGVGGDECPPGEWRDSPVAQQRIRDLGLDGERGLHGWFITQMADHLHKHGRRTYGWDEILDGGAPAGAVVAAWRGPGRTAVAARAGHDVVSCPDTSVYLDYRQSDDPGEPTPVGTRLTVEDVYGFEPVPPGLTPAEAARVLGGKANIWTEHMESARRVDYMAFPRLCAFAEAVWTAGPRDWTEFEPRLRAHLPRLDALGVHYRPLGGPRPGDARPDAPGRPQTPESRAAEVAAMLRTGL
jgi:hexosaminidase